MIMKIFSFKRILGLAAIGGAVAYARKNGGFKNAFNGLVQKGQDLARNMADKKDPKSGGSVTSEPAATSGYGSSSYMKTGYDQH
jgi:hypothetical protein